MALLDLLLKKDRFGPQKSSPQDPKSSLAPHETTPAYSPRVPIPDGRDGPNGPGRLETDRLNAIHDPEMPLGDAMGPGRPLRHLPAGSVRAAHPEWFDERGRVRAGVGAHLPRARLKAVDLSAMVDEATDGGRAIVETLVEVMAGLEPLPIRDVDKETGEVIIRRSTAKPTAADRVGAAKILADRKWGKAPVLIDAMVGKVPESGQFDLSKLTADEVRVYLTIARKARGELPNGTAGSGAASGEIIDVTPIPVLPLETNAEPNSNAEPPPYKEPNLDATETAAGVEAESH